MSMITRMSDPNVFVLDEATLRDDSGNMMSLRATSCIRRRPRLTCPRRLGDGVGLRELLGGSGGVAGLQGRPVPEGEEPGVPAGHGADPAHQERLVIAN